MRRLTPKERIFVDEVVAGKAPSEAARIAGYSHPSVKAVQLMKKPPVKALITRADNIAKERMVLKREEVLEQLAFLATRKSGDYVDGDGKLRNLAELDDRAQSCIDGFEQEVYYSKDSEGNVVGETVKTKVRLAAKTPAVDMAMKHFGLYAPESGELTLRHGVDWSSMSQPPAEEDQVEKKIEDATNKEQSDE